MCLETHPQADVQRKESRQHTQSVKREVKGATTQLRQNSVWAYQLITSANQSDSQSIINQSKLFLKILTGLLVYTEHTIQCSLTEKNQENETNKDRDNQEMPTAGLPRWKWLDIKQLLQLYVIKNMQLNGKIVFFNKENYGIAKNYGIWNEKEHTKWTIQEWQGRA